MILSMIAAVGRNLEIGKDNALLWRLEGDLPFFKKTTLGRTVIMGRRTFESLPKALPGRRNIVITREETYPAPGAETARSPMEALRLVKDEEEVFVIGGGAVYAAFLDRADRLYLTEAEAEDPEADAFFPRFQPALWERTVLDVNEKGIPYEHVLYVRKASPAKED